MPPVDLKFVVSFTSQDDHHRVINLTNSDGISRKWLSHPSHRTGQIEAVFQLNEDCVISYMDIGVQWCASVEVQVGKSDWPQDREYLTILPTVSFMNPVECRTTTNPTKTRKFDNEDFSEDVCQKKWDRIKVICRQPFRKDVQFGLCFLKVHSKDVKTDGLDRNKDKNKSVKSIQKHFFGQTFQSKSHEDILKSRLMKIAGSSENGTEHHEAMPRTAKLVLAASEGKKTPKFKDNIGNRPFLYSNHLVQKYGPQFEEEVTDFLASFEIGKDELDKVTIADIRHKFEKLKKRKLTQEEKKVFVKKARDHICEKFSSENVSETNSSDPTQNKIPKLDTERLKTNKYGYNWTSNATLSPASKDFIQKVPAGGKINVMKENENIKGASNEILTKKNNRNKQVIFSKQLISHGNSLCLSKSSEYREVLNDSDVIRVNKTLVKKNGLLQNNSASPTVNSPCINSTNDEWLSSSSPEVRNGTRKCTARKRSSGDSPNGRRKRSKSNSNGSGEVVNVTSVRGRGRKSSSQGGSGCVQGPGGANRHKKIGTKISNIQISDMETYGADSSSSIDSSEPTRNSCVTCTPLSVNNGSRDSREHEPTSDDSDDCVISHAANERNSNVSEFVECPVCCEFFSGDGIELHAQICCELNFN